MSQADIDRPHGNTIDWCACGNYPEVIMERSPDGNSTIECKHCRSLVRDKHQVARNTWNARQKQLRTEKEAKIPEPHTPQCDKWAASEALIEITMNFLEWMNQNGYRVAIANEGEYWKPVNLRPEQLIAKYIQVDLHEMNKERNEIVKHHIKVRQAEEAPKLTLDTMYTGPLSLQEEAVITSGSLEFDPNHEQLNQ